MKYLIFFMLSVSGFAASPVYDALLLRSSTSASANVTLTGTGGILYNNGAAMISGTSFPLANGKILIGGTGGTALAVTPANFTLSTTGTIAIPVSAITGGTSTANVTFGFVSGDGSGLTGVIANEAGALNDGAGSVISGPASSGFGWQPGDNAKWSSHNQANYFDDSGFHGDGSSLTSLPAASITGTLGVSNGGTGKSSATAYAPLFGGTTSTSAFQSGTVGSSGQVLTSNGAGALPTFQAASGTTYVGSNGISVSGSTVALGTNGVWTSGTGTSTMLINPAMSGTVAIGGTTTILQLPWVVAFEANRLPVVSDATPLSTWTDFSGNGNNATQSGSARPVYKVAANGINGNPVVRFDGSASYMTTVAGGASLTGDWYFACVAKWSDLQGYQNLFSWGDSGVTGKRRSMFKYTDSTASADNLSFVGQSADIFPATKTLVVSTPYFLELKRVSGVITISVNGVVTGSGSPTLVSYTSNAMEIGSNPAFGELMAGDISLILTGTNTDSTTIAKVRGYVQDTYGIYVSGANNTLTVTNPLTTEPVITSSLDALNVFKIKNKSEATESYSTIALVDPGTGVDEKGAIGLGKSNSSVYPWRSVYLESFEGLSNDGTILPIRIVQTRSTGGYKNYRRVEFLGSSSTVPGNIIFYKTDAPYPNETPMLTLSTASGDISMSNNFSVTGTSTLTGGISVSGTTFTPKISGTTLIWSTP